MWCFYAAPFMEEMRAGILPVCPTTHAVVYFTNASIRNTIRRFITAFIMVIVTEAMHGKY